MFVVIADISIRQEKADEFKRWFSESNNTISGFDGFVSRRLLEAKDGHHKILIEFEDMERFKRMHQSSEHDQVHAKAVTFMDRAPSPTFYNVVAK